MSIPPRPPRRRARRIDHAKAAMVGQRADQQDSAHCIDITLGGHPALLMTVADGMGGAVGGKRASSLAVAAFEKRFLQNGSMGTSRRLREALDAANDAIAADIRRTPELSGMGCTIIGVAVRGQEITWVSVGDSLLFTIGDGKLQRLNADHSLAALLDQAAERGEISHAEAKSSPQRSVLRSALTGETIAMIDQGCILLAAKAPVIAATDGILTLSESQIEQIAKDASSAQVLVTTMLNAVQAVMPDDQDNLTVTATFADRTTGGRLTAPRWARFAIGAGLLVFACAIAALFWIGRSGFDISGGGRGGALQAPRHATAPPPVQAPTSPAPIPARAHENQPKGLRPAPSIQTHAEHPGTLPKPDATPNGRPANGPGRAPTGKPQNPAHTQAPNGDTSR